MINLLPERYRQNLRAARANTLLVRYNILVLLIVVVGFLLLAGTYYLLSNEKKNAENNTAENNQAVASYSSVKERSDVFRSELSKAKQEIESNPHYAATLTELGQRLPAGAVIDQLSIQASEIGQQKTITVLVTGERQTYQVRDNLAASPYFSQVEFGELRQNSGASASNYPYTIDIRLVINRNAGAS